jgi:hypothetical protein
MPLFVLFVKSEKYGPAWFADLVNCFGWTGAELGYSSETALLYWIGWRAGFLQVKWYVDNYFMPHGPGEDGPAAAQAFNTLLRRLGLPIHKCTSGFQAPVLGFEADLAYPGPEGPQVLVLPLDKFTCYQRDFGVWGAMSSLSLEDIGKATGIAQFLSQVVPAGAAYCESMIAMRAQAVAKQKRLSGPKGGSFVAPGTVMIFVQPPAKEFFRFWVAFLSSWNRVAPIVQGFGPRGGAQRRLWVDSSPGTSGAPAGVGGLFWHPGAKELLGCVHVFTAAEKALFSTGQAPSAPVCEAMGLSIVLSVFAGRCARFRVLCETDSETTMKAHRRAFSAVSELRAPLRAARLTCARLFIILRVRSMLRSFAPIRICDMLCRGQVREAKALALRSFGIPLRLL